MEGWRDGGIEGWRDGGMEAEEVRKSVGNDPCVYIMTKPVRYHHVKQQNDQCEASDTCS